jgi:uncharacterized protein YbgA (DUF1722 family)
METFPMSRGLHWFRNDFRLSDNSVLAALVVPVTLLRHHARHLDVTYLNGQTFLEPHPKELMLRNHV